ncbi:hypothetical protein RRU94_07095 [Domibacillus sp. DTU_2020_1001157_1_SI_ALB_TIR_016]|uniref:hypothetical protein n=1 Tax=Domibacillus sp. DTU_2020_1001157_1_SI_ALB_TIR_016 TaxID=3077789 RepID=UPI0028E78FC0|nr:hypothetical protein [Domibacillus sp. DTU_2020_1001157_1_SI_ALB_TIR_016]WNS78220.1 hypothetical protein RRU94_07095 [Domibacillus sp. DTU_2020_1001157_1_SI_ALB_TIR_016]
MSKSEVKEAPVVVWEMEGVSVYVSRLVPVAVFGWSERSKFIREENNRVEESYSGYSFLGPENLNDVPEKFSSELREIKQCLHEAGYIILEKSDVEGLLPFEAEIPTILTMPDFGEQYTIFDAVFYWKD